NGTCAGSATTTQTVTVNANGTVPNSSNTSTLAAGNYSYLASYSGDTNYAASTATCEPFGVARVASTVATVVFDNATGLAWSGSEHTGASAHDTATIGGQVSGFPASGTVTYSLFTNGACSGTATSTQNVTVNANGSVPASSSTGALAGGSYAFRASYGGDGNYTTSTGACEPFTVATSATTVSTSVIDEATSAAWSGPEQTGATAHDTATIGGQVSGFPA